MSCGRRRFVTASVGRDAPVAFPLIDAGKQKLMELKAVLDEPLPFEITPGLAQEIEDLRRAVEIRASGNFSISPTSTQSILNVAERLSDRLEVERIIAMAAAETDWEYWMRMNDGPRAQEAYEKVKRIKRHTPFPALKAIAQDRKTCHCERRLFVEVT